MAKWHKNKGKHMKFKINHGRKHRLKLRKILKHMRCWKEPVVPSSFQFNAEILQTAEQRKQRPKELPEDQNDRRLELQVKDRNLDDLVDETTQKVMNFKISNDNEIGETKGSIIKPKSHYMGFKKVVETSDVILEVLDARDPMGSRCPEVEQLVVNSGKKLVFVLNKIDLIPKNNINQWLKYLCKELPTVAFKASIQTPNKDLSLSETAEVYITESSLSSRFCLGASLLIKLLKNLCRNQNVQSPIRVGIVGFPNVGKRSVIYSLKHFYSSADNITLCIANAMQGLSLDRQIEILDNPGTVYAKDVSPVTLALRNVLKPEDLKDVISPAEAIFQRLDHTQLCLHYRVPPISFCYELFYSLARKMNKFRKGDIPDSEEGARRLINDWNSGSIKYYTHPPQNFVRYVCISSEYEAEIVKAMDMSLREVQIELDKAPLLFPSVSIAAKSMQPTEGLVENEIIEDDNALAKVIVDFESNERNKKIVEDESNMLLIQYQFNRLMKKKFKEHRKQFKKYHTKRKKYSKVALALLESMSDV